MNNFENGIKFGVESNQNQPKFVERCFEFELSYVDIKKNKTQKKKKKLYEKQILKILVKDLLSNLKILKTP